MSDVTSNNVVNKFLDSMNDEKEYDFIANYYYLMTKEELKRILLEYIYASHSEGPVIEESIRDHVRDEIKESEIFE